MIYFIDQNGNAHEVDGCYLFVINDRSSEDVLLSDEFKELEGLSDSFGKSKIARLHEVEGRLHVEHI